MHEMRFCPDAHEYRLDGRVVPHITELLKLSGHIDDRWYTEESSERGRAVHALTAEFDLGALDLGTCVSQYRPWLLAYIRAMEMLRPTWEAVEMALIHPVLWFGGRPDRVGLLFGLRTILEIKTNDAAWCVTKATPIQTALQAILASGSHPQAHRLPPMAWKRYALYLRPNGKSRTVEHTEVSDLDTAMEIIEQFCHPEVPC